MMRYFGKKVSNVLLILALVLSFLIGNGFNVLGFASAPEPHKVGHIKWAFTQEDQRPEQVLIEMIDQAKKTVDVAIYSITHHDIVQALVNAKKRGLEVRIITDADQSKNQYQKAALDTLAKAKIPIKVDKHSGYMHMKVTITDSIAVSLGSFNYSKSAATKHDEVLMKIWDKEIGTIFSDEFEKMWNDTKRFGVYK